MGDYFVTDEAAADLAKLWDMHTERGGAKANAIQLFDGLLETFQVLADFPNAGTTRPYLQDGVLAMPYRKHMIFYAQRPERVDILHILYGSIDFEAYFSESG